MKAAYALVLFVVCTLAASGQEFKSTQIPDTTLIIRDGFEQRLFLIDPEFLPSRFREFNPASFRVQFTEPSELASGYTPVSAENTIDLISPWKLQMADQKKYRLFGSIIGAVQLGGAMYIAYKHVKKYGL